MNREFLELYNRELGILKEEARQFAAEFPGVAERLGGLLENNTDPMIAGLLEGTAYLASRVQLKLKHEYAEFTDNLLDQLVPDYLAPVPSAALLRVEPPYGDPNLKDGMKIAAGSYADARFVERERRIACKYRLASEITLWPFELGQAEFLSGPATLQALGIEAGPTSQAGLRLSLLRRSAADRLTEPADKQVAQRPDCWFANCRTDELTFHIIGQEGDAVRLYEQLFGATTGIYVRYLDEAGDPVILPLPRSCLAQIGFAPDEPLFPSDRRVFRGFDLLREYFVLPAKFLGFKLTNLKPVLSAIRTNRCDIVIAFSQGDSRLQSVVRADSFALYAAAASNLFEMQLARVPVKDNEHEYHVVTDRSRHLDFEAHRLIRMHAHVTGSGDKMEVYPLYAAPPLGVSATQTMFYTVRRLPRRRSQEERRNAQPTQYVGSDMFVTLTNHRDRPDGLHVAELSLRALCSNRHLTEHLPVGQGGAHFILEDKTTLRVDCVVGPTLPRDSIATDPEARGQHGAGGTSAWRLISMLSLNHLGLSGYGTRDSAASLREILSLFATRGSAAIERRIQGVIAVDSRPITRRIRQRTGAGVVRGLEVTVTLDEKHFEGSGIFLLGAILDRFLTEFVGLNNVVETVIRSTERGEIMRWPAQLGAAAAAMSTPPDLPQERPPEKSIDFSVKKTLQGNELDKKGGSDKSPFAQEQGSRDFLDLLRRLEHLAGTKPRIGESASSAEAVAKLGQQPHIDFSDDNVSHVAPPEAGPATVESRFLGMLGPQGALPLHTSYEATHWANMRDVAFARFLDIFNNRFQQLFFRAWANARPAVQADRPEENQFLTYLGAMIGIGTPAMRGRGQLHDFSKLALAGLMAPAIKSASRIEGMLGWLFDAKVEVQEFVGVWLPLEAREQAVLAAGSCALGVDSIIGRSAYSLKDKFRIRLEVANLDELETFLPDGLNFEPLADIIRFYLGETFIYDVEFGLAESKTKPAQLGGFGRLGWTCWMGRKGAADPASDRMRWDCHFHPAEIRAERRRKPKKGS